MQGRYNSEGMDQIVRAIRQTRGQSSEIARALKIERSAVYQWKRVPPRRCHQVAMIIGKPVEEIRPDIFKKPKTTRAAGS